MVYQDNIMNEFDESIMGVFQPFQDGDCNVDAPFDFLQEERKIMGEISSPRSPLFPKAPLSSPGISVPTTMHQIASFLTGDSVKVELRRRVTIGKQGSMTEAKKPAEIMEKKESKKAKEGKKAKSSSAAGINKNLAQDREWKILKQSADYQDIDFEITQATRLESESSYLWNTLFCTLKYRFYVAARHKNNGSVPYLITRPSIVCSDEPDVPVLTDYKNGPSMLIDGVDEVPLVRSNTDHKKNVACVPIKMGYLSYRKHEKEYCLQFSIYAGNDTSAEPIAVLRSDPVKIYARKPNKPRKRKRQGQEDGMAVEPPCKRPKVQCNLNEFERKLDELIALHAKMTQTDCSGQRQEETRRLFGQVKMMLMQ